jgi:nucleoside phosphorylase/tetratricopeptide (TPR) repeat protein
MHADILLVTATDVETAAVLKAFGTGKLKEIEGRMYRDLGVVNGAHVFMTQTEMGAGGVGATQQAVQKSIAALSPEAVISVGIGFGVNEEKQKIGDVLVAAQLRPYDLQRVGAKIILRGDKPACSPWLLSRFRSAAEGWIAAKIRFGVVLTGEKLVDNLDFREQLRDFEEEAIGGEMEGTGLYVSCYDAKVDWILVKAICDWGDGEKHKNKKVRQTKAAKNAAEFVFHALKLVPFKGGQEEPQIHSSLPTQPIFFGREKELAIVADAISAESRTWGVLIDGPGGIGKTALAIRAGHDASTEQFERKIFLSAKKRDLTPTGEQPLEDFMLPNFLELLSGLAREIGEENLERESENKRADSVRRALLDKRVLIVIDNVETFDERERARLYEFLKRLPQGCKAIVTSRRRTDIDARILRLERIDQKAALELIEELAKKNRLLERATGKERQTLYEVTGGNPLLIRWTAGQLGRGKCRTIVEACEFLRKAPKGNDPLEYIFGDLLDEFTASETAVLAALTHFTQPAQIEWIVTMTGLGTMEAQTALEDLTDRALVIADPDLTKFYLPPLTATFLKKKRPEIVAQTGDRLADRASALALENGHQNHERFPTLEEEWPAIEAALPRFVDGDSARLQAVCTALEFFLDFSGRWDEGLRLELQAEEKALSAGDTLNAGWRALWASSRDLKRGNTAQALICAQRVKAHWEGTEMGAQGQSWLCSVEGDAHMVNKNFQEAAVSFREALRLSRLDGDPRDISQRLVDLADAEWELGGRESADRNLREALEIAQKARDKDGVAACTGRLANFALGRKDWKGAEKLASETLGIAEGLRKKSTVAWSSLSLAEALSKQKRFKEALPFARRAVEIYSHLRAADELARAQQTLKECEADN